MYVFLFIVVWLHIDAARLFIFIMRILTFHFLLSSALVNHIIMTPRCVIFIIGLGWQMRTLTIVDASWLFLIICPLEISMLLKTE